MEAVNQTMRMRWPLYVASMTLANGFGALLVYVFIRHGLPIPQSSAIVQDGGRTPIFAAVVGGVVSLGSSAVLLGPVVRWQLRGGPPSRVEQMAALHAPLRQAIVHLVLWIAGGATVAVLTISQAPELAVAVVITVCMGATVVLGFTYMLGERILRPVAAKALSEGRVERTLTPGIGTRMMMTWGLGTFAPAIGIVLLTATQISTGYKFSSSSLAIAILALSILVIVASFALSMLTSGSISDPIRQLTQAIERVQAGETDVQVEVFDGSEIGRLKSDSTG